MKKVFLFAASMMLCAGLAFAQTPKKPAQKEQADKTAKVEQPAKTGEMKADDKSKHNCGHCPNAKKCDDNKKVKANPEAVRVDPNKPQPQATKKADKPEAKTKSSK